MNRLNPLYVGIFLLLLLLFFALKLIDAKKELQQEKILYEKTLKVALDTSALKKAFANKEKEKKEILHILSNPVLKSSNIKKEITNSGIHISSQNMDIKALNFLMGKILNTTFNITMLKIKRISENKSTLEVKIKW
ncbi:hypothetical protein FJR45_06855 [Sulfurimonas sediminis]|uniref:Type II secretion system protein M n=1 Tax=Sulfurimonas sediminis TaxID=2590020 RepID=A0A7M1B227_9BACT|nr:MULTISPECIES: hypothetical protein [Sulfurimonas]QOP43685.1 hypothetical protein FJR45_06855 [Sulfurimonas sediminis]UCM99257.1 hypothetical protein LCX93_06850 [Sulfurimonas sp. SWIR-19]